MNIAARHTVLPLNRELISNPKQDRGAFDRLVRILGLSVLGWPLYLFLDVGGPPKHDELSLVNHFNPFCAYFRESMAIWVMVTDIGLIGWMWCLYRIYLMIGGMKFLSYYFIPYLIVHHWLLISTFLHHTDWNIDRFSPSEWSWLRGVFSTIDRDYGWFLKYTFHHINDTHVIHHLFPKMPHYNAVEATMILKQSPVFGKYYKKSKETWYGALWDIVGKGRWIKYDNGSILKIRQSPKSM